MSLEVIQEIDTEEIPDVPMWDELKELRDELSKLGDINIIKAYIKENMSEEVAELQKKYKVDFEDIDKADPLRLEILQTLGEIGIMIY
jgi:uncharacterized protein YeeX (DUF496 family)